MINTDLISVIIPVYNGATTLKRCIRSVLSQSYSNLEILIIDNNSKDNSYLVATSFQDPRIKVLKCYEQGVAHARNVGLETARGSYISFLDCDDYYHSNAIQTLYNYLRAAETKFVYGNYERIYGEKKLIIVTKPEVRKSDLLRRNYIPILTVLVSRKLVGKIRFREVKHEDYLFWWELLSCSQTASSCGECVASYDATIVGISSNKFKSLLWHYALLRNEFNQPILKSVCLLFVRVFETLKERGLNLN